MFKGTYESLGAFANIMIICLSFREIDVQSLPVLQSDYDKITNGISVGKNTPDEAKIVNSEKDLSFPNCY